MKKHVLLPAILAFICCFGFEFASAQHQTIYGSKPRPVIVISASRLASYMGEKPRISTAIRGRVLRVTNTKGGWFDIDAGHGKIIEAHFTDYRVNLPKSLAGKTIVAEGIAARQFIADNKQHFAGPQKKASTGVAANEKITFEVKGMRVE
jgi:hypothetical protein